MMFASRLFSLIVAAAVLLPLTSAAPLESQLLRRQAAQKKCGDGGLGPCICNDALGLRLKSLKCPATTFVFDNPTSVSDGKMKKATSNLGVNSQCDHIVELQFIADKINANTAICTKLTTSATDFKAFFDFINASPNLVNVEATVNNAKGVMFGGNNFGTGTSKKAATGLASYLGLIKSDAQSVATQINSKMDSIMGAGNGFTNFASDYIQDLDAIVTKATQQAPNLADAAIPQQNGNIQIIDETQSTINRCKREDGEDEEEQDKSFWRRAAEFVVRQVTGKKSTSTTKAQACTVKDSKTATKTPAKSTGKTTGKTTTKSTTKAAAKPAAKPAAKSTKTTKKTSAKKPRRLDFH